MVAAVNGPERVNVARSR